MRSGPHPLAPALALACRERDAACSRLQAELAAQRAARAQLDQLQDYAVQTAARHGLQTGSMRSGDCLHNYGQFIARLAHAAALQTQVLAGHGGKVQRAQRALAQTQLRVTGLEQLIARQRQQQLRAQLRQEQKQSDEQAARRRAARQPVFCGSDEHGTDPDCCACAPGR